MSTAVQSFFVLANEFPWLMAPASLIAAILIITLIKAVFQLTEKAFKVMMIAVMIALTGGAAMVLFLYQ